MRRECEMKTRIVIPLLAIHVLLTVVPASGGEPRASEFMPADTMFLIEICDLDGMRAAYAETAAGRIWSS